jgi:Hydrazine synthase alpha subunit middle domain
MVLVLAAFISFPLAQPQDSGFQHYSRFPAIVFVQARKSVTGDWAKRFPEGSRLVRLDPGPSSGSVTNLTPEFFAAADPQVSPDAATILFSAQQSAGALWQVWEMDADGSKQHQITHCSADCLKPAFLPRGRIVYTVFSRTGRGQTSAVYVSEESGTGSHPITFGPGNFEVETVLQDGRILVSAASPLMAGGIGRGARTLYTMHPDGSELTVFRQDAHPSATQSRAEELSDGTVLFVKRPNVGGRDGDGELAWVRPAALHNSVVTSGKSLYWSAHELDEGTLVVSMKRPGASAVNEKFDLYSFDLAKRKTGLLIYRDPKFSSVEAVPLEQRPAPKDYFSILHPERKTGRVICLNAYLSAGAPGGRLSQQIASVRVLTLDSDGAHEGVLGEAPVEKDGSFYLLVPADQPVRFELLDAKGTVIRSQRGWIWTRPGEDAGCVGCHEDKAVTPENHWPLALKRMDTPIPLGVPLSPQPAHPVGVK